MCYLESLLEEIFLIDVGNTTSHTDNRPRRLRLSDRPLIVSSNLKP